MMKIMETAFQIEKWHYQPAMLDNVIDDNIFSFINNQKILHNFIGIDQDARLNIYLPDEVKIKKRILQIPIIVEYDNDIYIIADGKKTSLEKFFQKMFDVCYYYENYKKIKNIFCIQFAQQEHRISLRLFEYDKDDFLRERKWVVYEMENIN
ncbi:MAG: hypothetical protein ACR2NY_03795 [Alphaproteobacteria bacterium]